MVEFPNIPCSLFKLEILGALDVSGVVHLVINLSLV